MRWNAFLLIFGILLVLFLPNVFSKTYYADLTFDVSNTGAVNIQGASNHPLFSEGTTDNFTSKKGAYWTLNITAEDVFSDYIYKVILPEGSVINYIKTPENVRIEESNGRINLISTGTNEKFFVAVQYKIVQGQENSNSVYFISLPVIIVLGVVLFIALKKRKNKEKPKEKEAKKEDIPELKGLSTRQKQIVKILFNEKKPLTQGQLMERMKIPKASVSRNLRTLELKGVIEKEKAGMSNIIRLKK